MYNLTVTNGQVSSESGFYFIAAPFTLEANGHRYSVDFKRGAKDKVAYILSENGSPITELFHNDYTFETSPEAVRPELLAVACAFVKLGITTEKNHGKYFSDSDRLAGVSYTITQPDLILA
ncbi:MAG: hypothetical protein AB7F28_03645 [Candidatus Margulisiibacteriota bacterium]